MRLIGLGLAALLTAFVLLLVASHPIAPVTAHAGGLPTPSTGSPATPTTSATATRNADPTEASEPSEPSETAEPTEAVEAAEPPEPTPASTVDLKLTGELQLEAAWGLELALAVAAAGVAVVEGHRSRLIRWVAPIVAALLLVFLIAGVLRSANADVISWSWFVFPLAGALVFGAAGLLLLSRFRSPKPGNERPNYPNVAPAPSQVRSRQSNDEFAPSPERLRLQLERINYLVIGIAAVLIVVGFVTEVDSVSMTRSQGATRGLAGTALIMFAFSIVLGVSLAILRVLISGRIMRARQRDGVSGGEDPEKGIRLTKSLEVGAWVVVGFQLLFFGLGVLAFAAAPGH
jgi:uncharacterized membrane protein